MQTFIKREQNKAGPSSSTTHSAVDLEYELNPAAEKRPIKDAGGPSQKKTLQHIGSSGEGDEQRRKRKRGKPSNIKARESQQQ